MTATPDHNFAGRLVNGLGGRSFLIDAATGFTVGPAELPGLIAGYGYGLGAAGLRAGDRILVGCSLSPLSGLAYLGAMYAGFVPVPVDDRSLASSGDKLLQATGAKALWTEQPRSFDWLPNSAVLRLHGDLSGGSPREISPAACRNSDLAALMATSGSTGVPRFVMISHGNLTANTEAIIRSQHIGEAERAMLILPLSYCFGASIFHTHLYRNGGVVFDRRFMFPDKVLQAIVQYGCTTFAGVPTVYNVLLHRSRLRAMALPSLKRLLQAGGALAPQRIEEARRAVPGARFYTMYGQTEATARISCLEPERLADKCGSVGRPLDNLTVRIVNEHGTDLPAGQVGEIWVQGPSISHGYLNDPVETERVFKGGWLRTGDFAHQDAEGYLWIHGRSGAFLKMRGLRVSFAEAEAKVAAVPGVFECVAMARSHPEAGEALALLVVREGGRRLSADQLRQLLPAHWVLDSIRFVEDLPRNAHGKIARGMLSHQPQAIDGIN
jgi:acyl-CoA synthetase (AMP-forming)/AMP-acid ligase II